jgi:hypothetical protein
MLLGFYPSVQITSQFMSHDWELVVSMESRYFSRSYWKFGQNNVPENEEEGYIQYMPYLVSWRLRRCNTINAVPRQSFVIHPNGGWWQSSLKRSYTCMCLLLAANQVKILKYFREAFVNQRCYCYTSAEKATWLKGEEFEFIPCVLFNIVPIFSQLIWFFLLWNGKDCYDGHQNNGD